MKFLFVLSLMLCYSSAQNANDPSEYIVQLNLRERLPSQNTKTFPAKTLKLVPLVNDHLLWATATTLFGSDGLMISIGFNLL